MISGLSKRRFKPFTTYGMLRRRISATRAPASFATDRNSTAKSDHERPRDSDVESANARPRMASIRSQTQAASAAGSSNSSANMSPRCHVWCPPATIFLLSR